MSLFTRMVTVNPRQWNISVRGISVSSAGTIYLQVLCDESPRHRRRRWPSPLSQGGQGGESLIGQAGYGAGPYRTLRRGRRSWRPDFCADGNIPRATANPLAPLVKGGRAAPQAWRGDSSQRSPSKSASTIRQDFCPAFCFERFRQFSSKFTQPDFCRV